MSQENGTIDAPEEPDPDDIVPVTAIKVLVHAIVVNENLSLLERLYALESLREYIYGGIDAIEQALST